MVCPQPFQRVEILDTGDVYTCCPALIFHYSLGNVYTKIPFNEIWNGEKAAELRKRIAASDYSLCNDMCNRKGSTEYKIAPEYDIFNAPPPEEVSISSDNSCNIQCIFCRDRVWMHDFNEKEAEREIEEIWLPVLKGVKLLKLGETGEPFSSPKERMLIRKAAEAYPELKFHIQTNGILGNEKLLNDLGIYNRLWQMTVSAHSITEETYKKIVLKGGDFKRVFDNIRLYSEMKKSALINLLCLNFVVFSENYHEMADFAQFAKDIGATAHFWGFRKASVGVNMLLEDYDGYYVINPEHKEHSKLIEILNRPIMKENHVFLFPELKKFQNR